MIGIQLKYGFLDLLNTEFQCPKCKTVYQDLDHKFLNRCDKNKSCITTIHCSCGQDFKVTYNYKGDAVSFL